jgi:hypothetical protein
VFTLFVQFFTRLFCKRSVDEDVLRMDGDVRTDEPTTETLRPLLLGEDTYQLFKHYV